MAQDLASETGTTLHNLLLDPNSPEAWSDFVDHYGPTILRWCRKWHLQDADAHDVTQTVLTKLVQQLRTFVYDPAKGSFRSWLKTLTHHAWHDFLEGRKRAGSGGNPTVVLKQLQSLEARSDLLGELDQAWQRQLLETALLQVQLQVSSRDWKIFQALVLDNRPAADVAAEFRLKIAALYTVKSRVQTKLQELVRRLDGADAAPQENAP